MWTTVEDGRQIQVGMATSVVPDHANHKASLYGYEVLMIADSKIIYDMFFPVHGEPKQPEA